MDKPLFFREVLRQLGITPQSNNVNFLLTWSRYEGKGTGNRGEGGKNNPLNTTWDLKDPSKQTLYNTANVKNYLTFNAGVDATVKTLKQSYYKNIVTGLKNNVETKYLISKPEIKAELKKWGTHNFAASTKFKKEEIKAGMSTTNKVLLSLLFIGLLYTYLSNINFQEIKN